MNIRVNKETDRRTGNKIKRTEWERNMFLVLSSNPSAGLKLPLKS